MQYEKERACVGGKAAAKRLPQPGLDVVALDGIHMARYPLCLEKRVAHGQADFEVPVSRRSRKDLAVVTSRFGCRSLRVCFDFIQLCAYLAD